MVEYDTKRKHQEFT